MCLFYVLSSEENLFKFPPNFECVARFLFDLEFYELFINFDINP